MSVNILTTSPEEAKKDLDISLVADSYSILRVTEADEDIGTNTIPERSMRSTFRPHLEIQDLFTPYSDSDEDTDSEIDICGDNFDHSRKTSELDLIEFEADWYKHWEESGSEIVNKSWLEKYKDYVNPNFDLSTWTAPQTETLQEPEIDQEEEIKNCAQTEADIVADSLESSVPLDETQSLTGDQSEAETQSDSDTCNPGDTGNLTETDVNTLWAHEWEAHYLAIYSEEYNKFYEAAKLAAEEKMMPEEIKNNPKLKKYWVMRYHLFSKYDDGIKLDEESWFSVTPESIAKHIAARCRRVDGIIVDAFCGCGGNTIAFAKKFAKVIAMDIDPVKIEYAKHNAKIYGVEDKIEFIVGNYMELAPTLKADVVFLSPPWGGPEYCNVPIFDLKKMKPLNGYDIFEITKNITSNIAYYVPRNTNKNQLAQLAGEKNHVEIERNFFNKRVKTITAYYGNLIKPKCLKKFVAKKDKKKST